MQPQLIRERVQLELHEHIAYVTLSRPEKYNGLDFAMMEALVEAAALIRANRDIRAVIMRAQGKAFCAGLDFGSVTKQPVKLLRSFTKYGVKKTNLFQEVCWCWRKLPVPVIAVLHGYCYGGGMQIALAADFRISTPDCEMSIMEIKWGLVPDMTGTVTLRELVPIDVAKELTMTGRLFDGREAKQLNLVTRLADDPMAEAEHLAGQLAARSPDAVSAAKVLFQDTWVATERAALATESRLQFGLLRSKNQRRALRANSENRTPEFQPREKDYQ